MHNKHTKNEEGGELIVVGHDKVHIPLIEFPHRVEVQFKHVTPPSCDPHHHHHHHSDELEWEVHRNYGGHHKHQFTLIIKWKVHEVREIFWRAYC